MNYKPAAQFRRNVLIDAVRLVPALGFQVFGSFLITVILGVYLSPAAMAMYVLFWVGQAYFVVLLAGWLNGALGRFVAENVTRLHFYNRLAGLTVALIAVLGVLLACALMYLFPGYEPEFAWVVLVMVGSAAFGLGQNLLRAAFDHVSFSLTVVLVPIVQIALLLILLPNARAPVATALMCMGLPYLPVTVWQALRLRKVATISNASPVDTGWSPSLKQSFSYGFPLTLAQFGIAVLQTGDRYIIAPLVTSETLGVYAFWTGMGIQVGRGIFGILFPVITPRLFQVWGRDQVGAVRNVQHLFIFYVVVVIPALIVVGYALPLLLAAVGVSDQYTVGRHFIWFGLTAMILLGVIQLVGKQGEFAGKTMSYAIAAFFGSLAMTIVDLIFVPIYGVVAAGYGLVAGFVVALLCMLYHVRTAAQRVSSKQPLG